MSMNFENFDGRDCLIKAVKSKNAENVERVIASLLSHGRDITRNLCTPDQEGYSALHHAVLQKDPAMVKKLLMHADRRCINMESHDRDRSTALLLLCKNCTASHLEVQEEILASLLHAGANPNLPERDPFSLPLLCVLEKRWWRGAELMLDAGADATATDSAHYRFPATRYARDNVEILRNLLSKGCLCPSLNNWIVERKLTDAQLATILPPYILFHPESNVLNVLLAAASALYHESALYILEHYMFDRMDTFEQIICDIFKLNNGINWADKKKYITALTKNSFSSELNKNDLLIMLFLTCARSCPKYEDKEECCGLCDINVEQIWINLEHILRLAEHNGLPIEKWKLSKELIENPFFETVRAEWTYDDKGTEKDVNVLNLVLLQTTLCSVRLVLKLLLLMKQKGFRLTVSSAAAFLSSPCTCRPIHQNTDINFQAIVHPESPYRILLSELIRNCCEEGQCWFRSPRMMDLCRSGIRARHHFRVLMLLHLGVHELFLSKHELYHETQIAWPHTESERLMSSIVHRYAPRWKLRTPPPGSLGHDEMRWLRYHYRPEEEVAFLNQMLSLLNQMAPLRSLKELCRLSIRASLGHCRIEEKTEGLRNELPASLREYLYFRDR
ncbi:uncharacterized protein LOC108679542 isoform X2 [Hyalella azteca]|uniref:Uncharacterized protein LOC108679542 isoform X2 n=1 Tax=Hyalella azteca TaxID=294128 RepID=A0A979FYH5_HYAAZ|nr:uncharacterized protein LOC108679542 isoform X2 [Hyalella azteca]